jgi:hypothetical protein
VDDFIELAHFVGEQELSGIQVEEGVDEESGVLYTMVTLILNDTFFTFKEDPCDGRRSKLGEVYIDEWRDMTNIFHNQTVLGQLHRDEEHENFLDFVNPRTDEVVLRIGTMDAAFEYSYFVFEYFPEYLTGLEKEHEGNYAVEDSEEPWEEEY